jgi:hypothetical protein
MAKARTVEVQDQKLAAVINEAVAIDDASKSLNQKGKAAKDEIIAMTEGERGSEASVRFVTPEGEALVSQKESFPINTKSPAFEAVKDSTMLDGTLSKSTSISVKPEFLEELRGLLGSVKFAQMVEVRESFSMDPDGFREIMSRTGSPQVEDLKAKLNDCVSKSVSHTVRLKPKKK